MNKNKILNFKTIIAISLIFLNLSGYTNKTYLRNLDHQFINPTETFSLFASKQADKVHARSDFGASLFYYQSTNHSSLGRYFGCNERNNVVIEDRKIDMDVNYPYLIHKGPSGDRIAKVKLYPKQTRYGLDLYYLYDFTKILKNLYFKINLPVERLKNDIRMHFSSTGYPEDEDSLIIKKYLKGKYQDLETEDALQSYLTKSKLEGKQSKCSIPSVDLYLAYKVFEKINKQDNKNIFLHLGLKIPTGNKPKGEYLFEPIVGNGNQWGLNLGLETYSMLYKKNKFDLNFIFDLDYDLFFQNSQKRILSIKGANWGQYYLLGKKDDENKPLTPAANLLTQNIKVSYLNQLTCNLDFLFNIHKFNFNLGSLILFREDENIKFKEDFPKETYAVASDDFDTSHVFGANEQTDTVPGYNYYWLSNKSLDKNVAASPFVLSYKLYGDLGYRLNIVKLYFDFNIGGAYNFVTQNSNVQGWDIYFKMNFLF